MITLVIFGFALALLCGCSSDEAHVNGNDQAADESAVQNQAAEYEGVSTAPHVTEQTLVPVSRDVSRGYLH